LSKKKIILIDGNSLVYRAFFALPQTLATNSGQITNAVYGFTSMLIKLMKDEKPDYVAVAFDKGKPHRLDMYEEYKAHRPKTPDELRSQFPLVRDVLQALNILAIEVSGYEADDILATLASKLEDNYEVVIVTGDRDALQLISPSVTVLATKRGITDMKRYDREAVVERFGVPPEKMADLLGLKGDASDNIPGVPGVGEKTASKLIQEFGSLEGVLDNIDRVEAKRFQKIIKEHFELARLSKELAILEKNVGVDIDLDKCRWGEWDKNEVESVFVSLGFNSLMERLFIEDQTKQISKDTVLKIQPLEVKKLNELDGLVQQMSKTGLFAFDILTTGKYPSELKIKEIAITVKREETAEKNEADTYHISLGGKEAKLPRDIVFQILKPFFEKEQYKAVTCGAKNKISSLKNERITFNSLSFDCEIAAYLLKPGAKHTIDDLAKRYLNATTEHKSEKEFVVCGSHIIWLLQDILGKELREDDLLPLFEQIEMPLVSVLAKMEWAGVGVNIAKMEKLDSEVEGDLQVLEADIYRLAGQEFNINSSQQLSQILFEKLGLESDKKTKTGYSTDSSVLNKLIGQNPIIEKLLRYRELAKLKSTYIDALPKLINPKTGRLHTTFSQASTATGRLSSSNPNLQNIPVRTDLGRRVREAFVPARSTDELLVADYSQIELRILAHLSRSQNLLKAFEQGQDIHQSTASEVFGIDPESVDQEMRRRAKAVNFGIIYGISPFGLSEQLGISKEEARDYIDKYFQEYPEVKEFIDQTVADAYTRGFVETIWGRRRYIPELKSGNYKIRSLGERLAINTRIQGSAADIIKIAMIDLDKAFESQGLQAKMILQVHDELVFEVPPLEREVVFSLVKEKMEGAYPLKPELKIDVAFGSNWREAK